MVDGVRGDFFMDLEAAMVVVCKINRSSRCMS